MPADKIRFRFAKTGFLRLLSHHDLMRCLERMLRRADLPIRTTSGFRPGPRVVYPLPLPLGIVGWNEVVEMEFCRELDPEAVLAALNAQAPEGLRFLAARPIPAQATARVRRVEYRLPVPTDRLRELRILVDDLLCQEHIWIPRLRPTPKYLNIRPYLRRLSIDTGSRLIPTASSLTNSHPSPTDGNNVVLHMDVWVTQDGTARAEEIVRLVQLADWLDQGAVLERTLVELHDETPIADPKDRPPDEPADCRPLEPETLAAMLQAERCKTRYDAPEQRLEGSVVE
jgi:radical SAM-linked protein